MLTIYLSDHNIFFLCVKHSYGQYMHFSLPISVTMIHHNFSYECIYRICAQKPGFCFYMIQVSKSESPRNLHSEGHTWNIFVKSYSVH